LAILAVDFVIFLGGFRCKTAIVTADQGNLHKLLYFLQPRAQSAEGRKVFLNQRFVGFEEEGFTLSARVEMGGQGRAFTYIGQC